MLQKSVDGVSTARWIGSSGLAVAVGVAYFVTGELGLALLTTPERVAVFWPASGVAAGILIALGSRARTPVAAGVIAATIAANVMLDRSLWAALALASCNAGEALLVAWLIERWSGPSFHLDSLRRVLTFLVAAIVGTATVAVGAAWAMSLFGPSTAAFLSVWQVWFASDVLGMVTVAPLLIGLAAAIRNTPTRRELIEATLALVALTVTNGFVLAWLTRPWLMIVPATLLFPLLLWLGARCRPVFTAAGVFIIAAAIVWTTTYELGLYGDPGLHIADRVLAAQVAMLSTTLAGLALAALFDERRQQAAALIESEARLQEALSAGGVTAFDWDLGTGMTRRSENAAQMLGFDPKNPPSATEFLARVRPDDLARYKAFLQSASPDRPSFAWSFRFTRFDGREIWLEQSSRAEFDAGGLVVHVRGLTLDVTERKQAEEHQSILMAELDHRVRNVLARVAGVAMSTRQGSGSMDDFVLRLNGRIQAMALAHAVLSQSRWYGAGLMDLVRQQLAPYTTDANTTISGSDVMLTAETTQALAMVLHELVTNAAKYGALSSPDGRVSVQWDHHSHGSDGASLTIEWREFGGPAIVGPIQSGYGTNLIRELIPHELGGKVDLVFAADGACCRIEIPLPAEVTPDPVGTATFRERPVSV